MPVIVYASPKGGAGKSTSAVVLAAQFALKGATVSVIDADPNRPVSQWARRPGRPENMTVLADISEASIIETIEQAARRTTFVVVDLEGTASMTVAYAISRADLVIVPTQGSQLDAFEAAKAVKLIRQQEKAFGRNIPYALLFTRTNAAIRPRTLQHIRDEFKHHNVPSLRTQVARGLDPKQRRLFVIDGAKALRAAIERVFGERVPVQRCRTHKLRNVREHLPPHLQAQVTSAMRAAFRLRPQEGIAKLKQQASWLEREYPDAAGSLREGLEELFTINRLGLSPSLCRALGSTNIIENPKSSARRKTHRVTRWRDGEMVKRWAAAAFLDAEQSFRRILGYRDLWMLKAILNENQVANDEKAA